MIRYDPGPRSLVANLALYILAPLIMNGIIFSLHWDTPGPANPLLPPGWAVGTIWMLLFTGMGVARWLLLRGPSPTKAQWIDGLALLCLAYPLYTIGLRSETIGLAGTIVTAAIAFVAMLRIWRASRTAGALTLAVLAWLLYAETALARDLRH